MSYLTDDLQNALNNKFPNIPFEYREVNFGGTIPAFFINIKEEESLRSQWKTVTEFIAINFQSSLKNEFSVWNIYLFFITPDSISDELKYVIENDTFSSRKIVITPEIGIDAIIKEHILNSDLRIIPTIINHEAPFAPNPIIWEFINQIPPKKRVTEEITAGLNLIVEKLKFKDHEI